MLQKLLNVLPLNDERRRFQRVRVNLLGRYMLADRREFPCQVVDMSPGDIAVEAPVTGEPGQRVVAYIDHLGRLEGRITRVSPTGFAMSISATPRKRDKLAAQLTWLANRHILGLPEDREHERIAPRNPRSTVTMPNGTSVTCQIVDVSCAMSKAVLPSSSRDSSTRISWKRTSRAPRKSADRAWREGAGKTCLSFSSHRYRRHRHA